MLSALRFNIITEIHPEIRFHDAYSSEEKIKRKSVVLIVPEDNNNQNEEKTINIPGIFELTHCSQSQVDGCYRREFCT